MRSKPVGGIFGSPSGGLVPFRTMTSGLIMHSTISFCRRRGLSPSLRMYPPNNAYDDEAAVHALLILNQFLDNDVQRMMPEGYKYNFDTFEISDRKV